MQGTTGCVLFHFSRDLETQQGTQAVPEEGEFLGILVRYDRCQLRDQVIEAGDQRFGHPRSAAGKPDRAYLDFRRQDFSPWRKKTSVSSGIGKTIKPHPGCRRCLPDQSAVGKIHELRREKKSLRMRQ
nr:hypothetical protein [Massilia sp. ST3]